MDESGHFWSGFVVGMVLVALLFVGIDAISGGVDNSYCKEFTSVHGVKETWSDGHDCIVTLDDSVTIEGQELSLEHHDLIFLGELLDPEFQSP